MSTDSNVNSPEEISQLKQAIDTNDLDRVQALMTQNPGLHRAPLGYRQNGPLTWVAECRVPREPPGAQRLAMAAWMIENGSDIHQGGDGPLMRAALFGRRIAMMELLVSHGADVNAEWDGRYPIILAPCETLEPAALKWLLDHGANPNCANDKGRGTALDYLLLTYSRSPPLGACIEILLDAGCASKYKNPPVLALLRDRLHELARLLEADPALVDARFADLDIGNTGERLLTLKGATLLHAAAEFGRIEFARLLLDRGADINARANVDDQGIGGQTPIFHAVTQFGDHGLPVAKLLLERGADLSVRARLPGHYERPGEIVECTPLGYARLFPTGGESAARSLLSERGAPA
jgi:ankyrin repeat protein